MTRTDSGRAIKRRRRASVRGSRPSARKMLLSRKERRANRSTSERLCQEAAPGDLRRSARRREPYQRNQRRHRIRNGGANTDDPIHLSTGCASIRHLNPLVKIQRARLVKIQCAATMQQSSALLPISGPLRSSWHRIGPPFLERSNFRYPSICSYSWLWPCFFGSSQRSVVWLR